MTFGHDVFSFDKFVTFRTETTDLLEGWESDSANWTLKSINAQCPDKTGGNETCDGSPFSEFTIRGNEGTEMNDERWWWVNNNTLGLTNYDGGDDKSGACEIHVRDGFQVKIKVQFETKGEYGFMDDSFTDITTDSPGIESVNTDSFIALLKGGDQLSIDIDSDWSGTARFYLKVQGQEITNSSDSIDDEVYVSLLGVYVNPETPPPESGQGGGGPSSDGSGDDEADEGINWMLWGGIAVVGVLALTM